MFDSYNFRIFSNKKLPKMAAANGIINQAKTILKMLNPLSNEANGPTKPTKQKPADADVPEISNIAVTIPETVAVNNAGIRIIGY